MVSHPDAPVSAFPSVAIVLVNWNNWRDCVQCIDSLLGLSYPNFHIFVVDNDSQDESVERIRQWCAQPTHHHEEKPITGVMYWTDAARSRAIPCRIAEPGTTPLSSPDLDCLVSLVRSGGNFGFAGGCNVGIRRASTKQFEYFWFLNTDTVVDHRCLQRLVERARSSADMGMVGSTVLYYDQPTILQAQGGAWMNDRTGESRHIGEGRSLVDAQTNADVERQLAYIFGASMLVSSVLIEKVGLMCEDYFLYYEEMDWAMRSRAQFRFGYAQDSLVYHKAGNSSSRNMPLFTANLFYRNRIRFMSRFFPQYLQATKYQLLLASLRSLAKGHWAEVRLIGGILFRADAIARDAVQHQPIAAKP